MYKIEISKDFLDNFLEIIKTNPYLKNKFKTIKNQFKVNGLTSPYDIKKLNNTYFRLKIPPFRIILQINKDIIKFENIFKRKGKSNYKKFN